MALRKIEALADRFRTTSYMIRTDHHLPVAELSVLSEGDWARLEQLVFAILKPDAVAGGLTRPILEWLQSRGYAVRYADVLWNPKERQFEELYKFNLTIRNDQNQLGSWWLNRQLYTLGPSVLLLLEGGPHAGQVYQSIAADKGPSDPLKAREGQLRHDFRATNMTMNLFHCADDPFSTVREFLIFRDVATLKEVLGGKNPAAPLSMQLAGLDQPRIIEASLAARKLALRLLVESDQIPDNIALLDDDFTNLTGTRSALIELRSFFDSLVGLISEQRRSSNSLQDECLRRLLRFPYMADTDMVELLRLLEACGVKTSRWDALALVSTCHYVAGHFRSLD